MKNLPNLSRYLPILSWGKTYNQLSLTNDLVAAVIVTIMLIPQSLAYAMLAGLPPQMGLYASILPITLYAIFGTSRALAVGLKDEACAKEWLMEAPMRTANGRREPAHYYNDDKLDNRETHATSRRGLSKNVRQVFHKLVTSFLDIPEGDIYIEMGDEYFLTQVV